MGVSLSIIGNHSIYFKGKKISEKISLLRLLDSLELENSQFLKEMCIVWNSSYKFMNSEISTTEQHELERCLNIKNWNIHENKFDYFWNNSKNYTLEGPYGLSLEINKYYFELSIWIGSYYQWFSIKEKEAVLWREKWRFIIYRITSILSGKYVMYFPDTISELSAYWPCNFKFPKGMAKYLNKEINGLDQAIEVISEIYSKPLTLTEADRVYDRMDKDPFVVDYFEDLDKTLKI